MASRLSKQYVILALGLWLVSCSAAIADQLVGYSFDDNQIATGPDTFRIFEHSKGVVRLSSEFRYSGYYSVEIRDAAHDGGFPELQGYFPIQSDGTLQVHFAFMTPEPDEPFNIALAGPGWFRLAKDGIGFWLKNKNGYFYHVSDSIEKRLAKIAPFVWYLIDLNYRIDDGTYDLTIHREYEEQPVVERVNVPNATHQADSRVNVFSFIGDLPDAANSIIYVDDIEVRSDRLADDFEPVAPGRRKLFIDAWRDLNKDERKRPQCIPSTSFADFGLGPQDMLDLKNQGLLKRFQQIIEAPGVSFSPGLRRDLKPYPGLWAVATWRAGCHALDNGDAKQALQHFETAQAVLGQGRIYGLSRALALAALQRFTETDDQLATSYGEWLGEERFAAAQAMVGIARGDLYFSENVLAEPAQRVPEDFKDPLLGQLWRDGPTTELIVSLKQKYPDHWKNYLRDRLVTGQYYFLLLWRGAYAEAMDYSSMITERILRSGLAAGTWYEFQGNAAFLAGDYSDALALYQLAIVDNDSYNRNDRSVWLKLSDVHYLMGDVEQERYYRELVYGSLRMRGE